MICLGIVAKPTYRSVHPGTWTSLSRRSSSSPSDRRSSSCRPFWRRPKKQGWRCPRSGQLQETKSRWIRKWNLCHPSCVFTNMSLCQIQMKQRRPATTLPGSRYLHCVTLVMSINNSSNLSLLQVWDSQTQYGWPYSRNNFNWFFKFLSINTNRLKICPTIDSIAMRRVQWTILNNCQISN